MCEAIYMTSAQFDAYIAATLERLRGYVEAGTLKDLPVQYGVAGATDATGYIVAIAGKGPAS